MNWAKFIIIILGFSFLVSPFELALKISDLGRIIITIGYMLIALGISIKEKKV